MSQIDDAIQQHFETCSVELPKKFVPWTWVVGICVILLGAIGGTTAMVLGSVKDASYKADTALSKNAEQDTRLQKLEDIKDILVRIDGKLR